MKPEHTVILKRLDKLQRHLLEIVDASPSKSNDRGRYGQEAARDTVTLTINTVKRLYQETN